MSYRTLADLVLLGHAMFVGFVVLGQVLVLVGGIARWGWVRNFWFRVLHLLAILIVVGQAWGGIVCPLTTLESDLRVRAGEAAYTESFMAHWLHELLFFDAETWVFTAAYSAFGALVLASWLFVRPRRPWGRATKRRSDEATK